MTVNVDCAFRHIVKTGDKVRYRGLASAGRPHKGNHLPRLGLKRHMRKRRLAFLIRKGYVVHRDMAGDFRQRFGVGLIGDRLGQIQHAEHAVHRRHCFLQRPIYAGEPLYGIGKVYGISQKRHQRTGGNFAVHHFVTAEPHDERHGYRRQKFHRRRQQTRKLHILHRRLEIQFVLAAKALYFIILANEGLHHAHRRDAFLEQRSYFRRPFLDNATRYFYLAAENFHCLTDHRYNNQRQQRKFPVKIKHQYNRAD